MRDPRTENQARTEMLRRARALGLTGAAVVAALACLAPARARACSCMSQTPADALAQAAAVFEGRVREVAPAQPEGEMPRQLRVRLQVVRSFKGSGTAEELVVTTAADSAACGYGFELDRSYLVYALAQRDGLDVSLCGRTQPIEEADEDLRLLGIGATPVNPGTPPPLAEEDKAKTEPPARGGCASCSAGAATAGGLGSTLLPLALALAVLTCRRRS
jgi:hypothetical protein